MKALFSIFSLTAPPPICCQQRAAVTILKPLCPHFSLSELSWQMENLFVSVLCTSQKFPNLVAMGRNLVARGSTMGQVSVSHPRVPLLKNSIGEISFFSSGENIGEILSPISNHRTLRQPLQPRIRICTEHWRRRRKGGGGGSQNHPILQMRLQKTDASWGVR